MAKEDKNNAPPKVIVNKLIRAKREQVFDAWTKPELLQKWLVPQNWVAKSSNDLRVGGNYSHDMISDGSASGCSPKETATPGLPKHYLHTGEYLEIRRPEKLVFTWNSPAVQNSRVTVEFQEVDNATQVTITHELLGTEELRKSHSHGWGEHLQTLARLLV